jgi:maltose alpha-D-glucosyltransferase / alpha-amylase
VALPELSDEDGSSVEIFSDQEYPGSDLRSLELEGYGFRWIRLRRTHAHW